MERILQINRGSERVIDVVEFPLSNVSRRDNHERLSELRESSLTVGIFTEYFALAVEPLWKCPGC